MALDTRSRDFLTSLAIDFWPLIGGATKGPVCGLEGYDAQSVNRSLSRPVLRACPAQTCSLH